MKARDVLRILGITRRTLTNYINSGKIKIHRKENGFCEYDENDVLHLFDVESDNPIILCIHKNKKNVYKCDTKTFKTVENILKYNDFTLTH